MNATLMKRFFRVIHNGTSADVEGICRRVVEDERRQGHTQIAHDLERILEEKSRRAPAFTAPPPQSATALQPLPTNRRDFEPLVQEIPVEKLRHLMVLPSAIERRLARIEHEFGARSRCKTITFPHLKLAFNGVFSKAITTR